MKQPTDRFIDFGTGMTKGKSVETLAKSRRGYNELIAHFGGKIGLLPSSVMLAARAKPKDIAQMDAEGTKRSYKATSSLETNPELRKLSKKVQQMHSISGKGAARGALSIFWQDVGRSMVLFYTKPGDVVVDPFAGHNSRMDMCVKAGRHYMGNDLSHEFSKYNFKRADELRKLYPDIKIKITEGDSRVLPFKDEVGDFTITSPPYWDIEYYGDEKEQLGNGTYEEFLDGLQLVFNENFRCLKPGAISQWFVNDFRKGGKFYSYHSDCIRLAKRAGFIQRDMLIVDLGRGFRDVFINETILTRILPKRHEYGIVFEKPLK